MKRILNLRHSMKNPGGGDVCLSKDGQEFAVEIGRRMREFYTFEVLFGSDQIRTTQTGILMLSGMGQSVDRILQDPDLCGTTLKEWKSVVDKDAVLPQGVTLLGSVLQNSPDFYNRESQRLSAVYRKHFDSMDEGQTALEIGHSPIIEMAVVTLLGDDPNDHPALGECSGYELSLHEGVFYAPYRLFLPGPS